MNEPTTPVEPGAQARHLAARALAANARDAAELAALLDMLGLTAAEGRTAPADRPTPAVPAQPRPDRATRRLAADLLAAVTAS